MRKLQHIYSNISKGFSVRCMSNSAAGRLVDIAVDDEGIAIVTMQRPPVNSLNMEMVQALSGALDDVTNNKCHAMILTSAAPKVFSAGMDFSEIYKPDKERLRIYLTGIQDIWLKLFGSSFITAAAINGHAPAAGCLFALSCEYRAMVAGNYTIGYNETVFGSYPPEWFIKTMNNVISNRETELACTVGKMFSVDEALEVGLIDTTATDKADAIDKCKQFIKKFDKIPPLARALTKQKFRAEPLQWLKQNRNANIDAALTQYENPEVVKSLEAHVQSVKNKNRSK